MTDDPSDPCDGTELDRSPDAAGPATVRHDWTDSGKPSFTLTEAVAAATDRATTDLPPLQDRLDVDALDALLTHAQSPVSVSFTYADTTVSVREDGTVEVRVPEHAAATRREE